MLIWQQSIVTLSIVICTFSIHIKLKATLNVTLEKKTLLFNKFASFQDCYISTVAFYLKIII